MPRWTVISIVMLIVCPLASGALAQSICINCHFSYSNGMHAQGVGACNMCHTMHNSQDGALVDPDSPNGNAFLLVDSTPSDVCLQCHAGFVSETLGTDPTNPPAEVGAGNFVFLLEDNLNDGYLGATSPIAGDKAGHNIRAPGWGLAPDGTLATAPGGSFPASDLGCTSCHDPHGNGNFRMLNGAGPVQNGLYSFASGAPMAVGLSIYHGSERQNSHTAYNAGMSAWCGNCHGDFHETGTQFKHPSDNVIGPDIANTYNLYRGTSDPNGGSAATAYLAMVPFEDAGATYTGTGGPAASSRVMCLSCHRAHASSAPNAGRWDFNVTLLSKDGLASGSYPIPDPYVDPAQRSLCNKCHGKDGLGLLP